METVKVYWLHIDSIKGKEDRIFSLLPSFRVEKAKRFVQESDRLLSLAAGYLLYRFVGEYTVDTLGKPRAEKCRFSLSHSGEYAALAVSFGTEIGLDVEKLVESKENDALARYCLSDNEWNEYRQGVGFLTLFTAKESLVKAEGTGITDVIKAIPALPLDGTVEYNGKSYYRHAIKRDGYVASVTMEKEDFVIETEEIYVDGNE